MDRRAFLTGLAASVAPAGGVAAPKPRHRRYRHKPQCPSQTGGVRASRAEQPDVVMFLTDDMRADDWPLLRQAQARIGGTWFPHFCYDVALCSPTRATLLTGQMAHHHGIRENTNAARRIAPHEPSSLAPAVRAAGYHTAYVGKYMNGYHGSHVPPGWDDWQAVVMGEDSYQSACGYATNDLTRRAREAISHAPAKAPLFLVVSYHAPHGPSVPENRYAGANVGPTLNREDQKRKRCLLSVDDSIAAVARTMGARWESAVVLALSDNGFLLGEHDTRGKAFWWDQAARVPLLARLSASAVARDDRLVSSIDICPTVLRATGASPTWTMDGLALQDAWDRESTLISYQVAKPALSRVPFVGLKGKGWVYVEPKDEPARFYADSAEQVDIIGQIDAAPLHARLTELLA